MTKSRLRQLELPVMVDVNSKAMTGSATRRVPHTNSQPSLSASEFHKPASAADQSIYKAISDNYFKSAAKRG